MMDISDGLSTDLSRLCAASRVGARIWAERIPRVELPDPHPRVFKNLKLDLLQLALHGGDDYELLFTVPSKLAASLRRAPGFAEITQIGEVTAGRQISLLEPDGNSHLLKPRGWDPFLRKPSKKTR